MNGPVGAADEQGDAALNQDAAPVRVVCADIFEADLPLAEARLVYADPPYTDENYFGYGGAPNWRHLIERMIELGAPDAAYCLHMGTANLATALPLAEELAPKRRRRGATSKVRTLAWIKPWGAWRPGLTFQYAWEPILVWYGPKFAQPPAASYVDEADWIECPPQRPQYGHPTEKPAKLVRWIFDRLLVRSQGRLAIDLFSGSGTAAVLAARLGLESIAVERSPEFADVISARARAEADSLLTRLEGLGVQERLDVDPGPRDPLAHGLGARNRRAGAHLERGKRAVA